MHANLAEIDDVRVFRAGELLVLGNYSKVATGNDDHAVRLLAADRQGGFEFKITPRVRVNGWGAPPFRPSPRRRTSPMG